MKVVCIVGAGGPEVLKVQERPEPELGPDDVRVQVRASALNRADLLQARGVYPAPPGSPADIPGLEFAGEVLELGPRARRFKRGDRIMGIVGGGAFSEQLVLHERQAMAMPRGISFELAAALPEAFLTAFDALVVQGGLQPSDTVLVHAATSGVGTAALQLVRCFHATSLGTGRSKEKLARCAALGLDHAIVAGPLPLAFAAEVNLRTGGRGVDLALDLVGGSYVAETLACMAIRGRILNVGTMDGTSATLDLGLLLRKRLRMTGTVLRARPLEEKIALSRLAEHQLVPLFESGKLKPVVGATFPFQDVVQAAHAMARNETFGKVVLHWGAHDG